MQLDEKQKHIIKGWLAQAQQSQDPYFRFMADWIAFNALCYAIFHASANQQRADLKKFERPPIEDGLLNAQLLLKDDKIDITASTLHISLKIGEKYTEDRIFSMFARETQGKYRSLLDHDSAFSLAVDQFREAIKKPNGYYVLNLSKKGLDQVDSWTEAEVRIGRNFLSSFHDKSRLSLLKDALYQVRCNVFHGEKVPGEPNDDRIVGAASPILERLLGVLMDQLAADTIAEQSIQKGSFR